MKVSLAGCVSLTVGALVLCGNSTLAVDCTSSQLSQVQSAPQNPGIISACSALVIDASTPLSLTNVDFCKSDTCVAAIRSVVAKLPDCEMNGISISTDTTILLGRCSGERPPPPPGGPGGGPRPPRPTGFGGLPLPLPIGGFPFPPPPPGAGPGLKPEPTINSTENNVGTKTPSPTTATVPRSDSNATNSTSTTEANAETGTAGVKPADVDKTQQSDEGNEAGVVGGSTADDDTSINTVPGRETVELADAIPKTMTMPPSKVPTSVSAPRAVQSGIVGAGWFIVAVMYGVLNELV